MGRFHSMLVLFCITLFLIGYFLMTPALNWGGDIIEYYGISQSVISHFTPELTLQDETNLTKVLNPAYLSDPQYYIRGVNGGRYPVHFFAYSLLLIPSRFILQLIGQDEVKAFAMTNILFFSLCVYLIIRYFIHTERKRFLFLFLAYLSPVLFFFAWPGPEIFYTSLVMLAVFLFAAKHYRGAALAATIASWHSQPLIVLAAGLYFFLIRRAKAAGTLKQALLVVAGLGSIALIPYAYNLFAFGAFTPWTNLQNIWTQYYGFGLQNLSVGKWFEQFFDFDIGLFWYVPVMFLMGGYYAYRSCRHSKAWLYLTGLFLITAFFYQTNPAWNYGTAGYGPTRHILYFLPFILYFAAQLHRSHLAVAALAVFAVIQAGILSVNGFLRPDFLASLRHNPLSSYILATYPALYNPTPEIFVDRTNGTDLDYPTSAIYKVDGVCRKAYILPQDYGMLKRECGFIPAGSTLPEQLPLADSGKQIHTTEAVLTAKDCKDSCLSAAQIAALTHVEPERIQGAGGAGPWHIAWGAPFRFTVPTGYNATYYSFAGTYVNY